MKEKLYVGIDLGTTNSECFIKSGNNKMQPLIISEALDTCMLNSIVRKDEKGHFIVGNSLKNADKYKTSWKLLKTHLDKDLYYDVNGFITTEKDLLGIRPSLFSTKILEVIKNEIDAQYNPAQYQIENLVITVPANFRDTARRIVKQAALDAGFKVNGEFKLINEPTSAAVAYGQTNRGTFTDQKVIAYDLGGGTFDVTLLDYVKDDESGCNFYQAISTDGKNIGGKDFDRCLIDIVYNKFLQEQGNDIYKGDLLFKDEFYSKLLFEAEDAKIFLSRRNIYAQAVDIIIQDKKICVDISITREEFENAIEPLINETIELTKSAIAGYEDSIDSIILIGGSTKMPFVKEKLAKSFSYVILDNDDPDLIVAKGACYHACSIGENLQNSTVVLNEVLSNAILSNVVGNVLCVDIRPGTSIPCHVERYYSGIQVNQSNLRHVVCNGRGVFFEDDTIDVIGDLEITNLKQEGTKPSVKCVYDISDDELITVTLISEADPNNSVSTKFSINSNRNDLKNKDISFEKAKCDAFIKEYPSFNYDKQRDRIYRLMEEKQRDARIPAFKKAIEGSKSKSYEYKCWIIRISSTLDDDFLDNYIVDLDY